MRALFTSTPGIGHAFPLVPLAWAMRAAGHEVLFAFAEHTPKIRDAGLPVVDAAPGYHAMEVLGKAFQERPLVMETFTQVPLQEDLTLWAPVFAEINRPLVDRTVALARDWGPDLVVHEHIATFGLIAATVCGVPAVQRNLGTFRTNRVHSATAEHLGDLDRYGLGSLPDPVLALENVPPSMLAGQPPEGLFMRELPYNGGSVLGNRLPEPGSRPRVAVTLGTTGPQFQGIAPVERVVAAAPEVDAEFVILLGDADPSTLGDVPPNVRVVTGWTPLDALLRTCSGIVHHGGGGTTMTAMDAGVPQLLVVDAMDHGVTAAAAVRKRGAGLVAAPDQLTAALLQQLLTDDQLRTTAAEIKAEIQGLPTPADIVPELTALAG
jgi:calicheamicinone 4-hydroxyamino-4,6-dideoxy-alpha-D-glucosyltransferase